MFSLRMVAALALGVGAPVSAAYTVTPLVQANGQSIFARVSEDGTVFGQTRDTLRPVIRRTDGTYEYPPTLGGSRGSLQAINAAGTIVGASRTGGNAASNRAFIRAADGTTTVIPVPAGGSAGFGAAINDTGTVVGSYTLAGRSAGYRWTAAGGLTSLANPAGFDDSRPLAINASGLIAGNVFNTVSGVSANALWATDGTVTVLPVLGDSSYFGGFNNAGVVSGSSQFGAPPGYTRATVWIGGVAVDAGTLPGDTLSALGDINNNGVAIGFSATAIDMFGFISGIKVVTWSLADGMRAINVDYGIPGFTPFDGRAINDAGQIIVSGYAGGSFDPIDLLLTPVAAGVPEPASWALLIAGFGLSGLALRRRRVRVPI